MKKSILFSMAFAAILSSCSKDNDVDSSDNGLVEIQLGAGESISSGVEVVRSSRGVVNEWNNTKVGFFALSNDGGWDNSTDPNNPTVLWNNAQGVVASNGKVTVDTSDGQAGYYPNQGTLNYSFYGYYLKDVSENISEWGTPVVATNTVKTTFTIDGSNDVLWGKAEAPQLSGIGGDSGTKYDGYNATYFRKGDGAKTPSVAFGHLLAQLQFNVQRSDSYNEGQSLYLKSISVKEVPTQFDLTIADKSGSSLSGNLVPNTEPIYGDLSVKGIAEDGVAIKDLTTATAVGEPVMLYTDGETTKTYKIEVVIAGGTEQGSPSSKNTLTITAPNNGGTDFYEVGHAYKVNLKVNSLEKVEVEATLAKWEVVDTPIEGEI